MNSSEGRVWAALADPAGGRDRVRQEDDADRAALSAALAACMQVFENQEFTASEAARAAESNRELTDSMLELARRDKLDGALAAPSETCAARSWAA